MSDVNKDLGLFWIFLLLTMSVNSNLVQLINISQDNSRFKQINFSESSDFQQLRCLSTRQQISQEFFVRWLFCLIVQFKPIKLIAWKIRGEKLKSFYFSLHYFLVIDDWFKSSNTRKKIAAQKIVTFVALLERCL